MKPRVILVTQGSLGDLHPFIALGLALRERGAQVALAGAAEYRAKVERAGLEFRAVRPSFADMQADLRMDRSELTRAVLSRSDFLLRTLVMPYVRVSYDDTSGIVGDADLVLTSSLAFGARLAAERREIPWMAVVLQPLMFLSAFDPPEIPRAAWLSRLLRRLGPKPTRRALEGFKYLLGRQLGPVHELRREIGLAPARQNPLFEGQFSPLGALGLYSSLLGEVQPDYPAATALVGFARFDSEDGGPATLGEPLEQFLRAGDRPLVFTLGSLIVHCPGAFYEQSVSAARRLGIRAVLLVGEGSVPDYAGLAGADVHICAYAPHSLLFPRAAAVVHQAGIGTLAQALRAGRPQLIVPYYADQLDNASRAVGLGVARRVAPKRYRAETAARELDALTRLRQYGIRAAEVAGALAGEDGAARGADIALNRITSRHST